MCCPAWAGVAGFADWKGSVTGVNFLGSFAEATYEFLDLSRHFSPWFDWFIGLVGLHQLIRMFHRCG